MRENPYYVQSARHGRMFGRKSTLDALVRHLTKETPDHISVIGPKLIGKSVLLKHLADYFRNDDKHFIGSIYWDLHHHTPRSDAEFITRLAEALGKSLRAVQQKLSREIEHTLRNNPAEIIDALDMILKVLEEDNQRVLVVMDDFDRVLTGGAITRNLWDSMRDLALHSSLVLVTGSKNRLRELCHTEDSETSNFWNVFYVSPVKVSAFSPDDVSEMLKPFEERDIKFDNTAFKELLNWTGGVPLLVNAVAEKIYERKENGFTVTKSIIDDISESIPDECHDILSELWNDCPEELRRNLMDLVKKDIPVAGINDDIIKNLQERGYVTVSGNKIKHNCRILKEFSKKKALGLKGIDRLFGSDESFKENIKDFLEIRLAQCDIVDKDLYNHVKRAINDITTSPLVCIGWIRWIADRAVTLILMKELPDNVLPQEWVDEWNNANVNVFPEMQRLEIPETRYGKCHLLNLMTGTIRQKKPVAKYISKPTVLLVDFLQSVGDFGNHYDGSEVATSFAASVCSTAIDLCERLAREIGSN